MTIGCYVCNGAGIVEDYDGDRPCLACYGVPPCRFGYLEDDGFRYCYAHGGFANNYGPHPMRCDRKPDSQTAPHRWHLTPPVTPTARRLRLVVGELPEGNPE